MTPTTGEGSPPLSCFLNYSRSSSCPFLLTLAETGSIVSGALIETKAKLKTANPQAFERNGEDYFRRDENRGVKNTALGVVIENQTPSGNPKARWSSGCCAPDNKSGFIPDRNSLRKGGR